MKRYAKNPAPDDIETLQNPAEFVIQNPTPKTNKKMAKRKRDSDGKFKSKRSNPMDAADEFVDTGKNLFMQYGLAALASTGTVKGAEFLINQVPDIPQWAKEWAMIAGPAAAGIIVSMMADRRNAIWQGVSGGMVLASANGLSDKLIKGESPSGAKNGSGNGGDGMSDGVVEKGDLIVKPDGYLYDQDGKKIARIDAAGMQADPQAMPAGNNQAMVPETNTERGSFSQNDDHLLQDSTTNFEQGEVFNP
ncbi:hypothetical protein LX73_2333 [Fodinibius salinus]|uniref:Uncharacterized protein n=1 Tax=Fodinibius salinus TaxID=860790 RepID=A0A5D3YF96_9BACT|nr:hypothetical protein [Fodinibius salinus]TYP92086.1 hypothetical protein LX73_2333 [Fodinibius salinus]